MKRVLVLGATGMVGSMVHRYLDDDADLDVWYSDRSTEARAQAHYVGAHSDLIQLGSAMYGTDYVINCIGLIKPYIKDDDMDSVEKAVNVNVLFVRKLALAAERVFERVDPTRKCHVINIATDCVFSGDAGKYKETDYHDAWDVYGKTKSLGEVHSPYVHHLRQSLIGPEKKGHRSLLDWFLSNPDGSTVKGFYHHEWNGITTLAFAKICAAIVKNDIPLPHLQHVVPKDSVNKRDLLRMIAEVYGRDIKVKTDATEWMDRTLDTSSVSLNEDLWIAAGYENGPPTIEEMVKELHEYGR